MDIDELIEEIIRDVNYEAELQKLDEEQAETKRENLQEFVNKAVEYQDSCEERDEQPTLSGFLEEVALIADIDSVEDGDNRVLLMTLHGAKGLEFPRVYLCGMEEDLFPSSMAINSDNPMDIEEERRLAYVGITRAKDHLTLTGAQMRMVHGETWFHQPSRFIKEIPDGMLDTGMDGVMQRRSSAVTGFSGFSGNRQTAGFSGFSGTRQTEAEKRSYSGDGNVSGGTFTGFGRNAGGSGTSENGFSGFSGFSQGGENRRRSIGSQTAPAKRTSISGTNPGYGKDVASLKAKHLDYGVGDRVVHSKFGAGTVVEIEDQPKDFVVTVDFDTAGQKKMMAGFAKLQLE
jgi:DNA helicase-2/ATP-dependent DNA helicase PcrA